MKLSANEKQILKLLLKNAKSSDSAIAAQLSISSQAVGKIRRKLEKTVINSYTLELDFAKFGIETFALALASLTEDGQSYGEEAVVEKLLSNPHVIQLYRVPARRMTYIVLYGFHDTVELDEFFKNGDHREHIHKFVRNEELFYFSHNNLMKNDPVQLFNKVIDSVGGKMETGLVSSE